jgi:hypothetical protein
MSSFAFDPRISRLALLAAASLLAACAGGLDNPEDFAATSGASHATGGASGALSCVSDAGQAGSAQAGSGQSGSGQSGGAAGSGSQAGSAQGGAAGSGASAGQAGAAGSGAATGDAVKGQSIVSKRGCRGCHGEDLAGTTTGGWASNLTPDAATGLGSWTPAQITAAIRSGQDRENQPLCSTMPLFSTTKIPDADMADLLAYLRSLPPVNRPAAGDCSD